jgi:lipoprotein-anchoring transpeptidase ErfK/SrfK
VSFGSVIDFPAGRIQMLAAARTTRVVGATALVAVALAGCSHGRRGTNAAAIRPTPSSSVTSSTESTSTTMKVKTTAKPLPGLGPGASGPAVLAVEQKLASLRYDPGSVDGRYDSTTAFAVTAFQKVNGMARTGRATDEVVAALQSAGQPAAMVPTGGGNRVEVDLKRQVLFLYQGGSLVRTLPVSTGSGQRYCVDGQCDRAVTPGGSFRIGRKILGDHVSKLGHLYNPLFFNGGIAIHGEPAVPSYPASHGCVRIPMADSLWFYNTVSTGTPVYVLGGAAAPVPFNEPAPGEKPPNSTTSTTGVPTTTTVKPTTTTTIAPTTTTTV